MNIFNKPRKFTTLELKELQGLHQIASAEKFKAEQIKNNTALIPDGQKLAEQTKVVAELMEQVKSQWIAGKLLQLGYPQGVRVNIDILTGKIMLIK